jgi:hypothetical protein
MIQWTPDASEPVEVVLACDPSVQAANDAEALDAYLGGGDPSAIDVPDDATRFTVKPLTDAEMGACKRDAGRPSVLGERLLSELREADDSAAEAEKLSDEEFAAVQRHAAWNDAFRVAVVSRGLVSWGDGAGVSHLDDITPGALRGAVKMELHLHILRLSTLGAEGKGRSASRSG